MSAQEPNIPRAADFSEIRRIEFPWTGEHTYLNNASQGPLPLRTIKALIEFNELRGDPTRLPDDYLSTVVADARASVAKLLNADESEIALVPTTSYGLNVTASCLPVHSGETVVLSDLEFPANVEFLLDRVSRGGSRT